MRPKLTAEQTEQLAQCFDLMDADGSGAIDAEERARAAGFDVRGVAILAHPAAGQATNSCVTSGP